MRARTRLLVFGAGASVLALALLAAAARLPRGGYPGPYGTALNRVAVQERHATDVVAAVTYDYRGFDTLGEETILFASVAGAVLLLRRTRSQWQGAHDLDSMPDRAASAPNEALRLAAVALVPVTITFGLYLTAHGQVSPGGGFQGGVILASAPLLVYVATRARDLARMAPWSAAELGEAAGLASFVGVGVAGLAATGSYLANVLPLGSPGDVLSAGTILALSGAVALAVGSGLVLMLVAFVEETIRRDGGGGR